VRNLNPFYYIIVSQAAGTYRNPYKVKQIFLAGISSLFGLVASPRKIIIARSRRWITKIAA